MVGKALPKSSSFSKSGGPTSPPKGMGLVLAKSDEAWWGSAISVAAMKVESAGAAARVKVAKVSKVAARNSSPRTLTATMKESNYAPMLHM